jgi:hypothetical protein
MPQTVIITIAAAGTDTGPFNIYSNADAYVTAFASGIAKSALLAGYTSSAVPDAATSVRVKSNNDTCTNYVDMAITGTTTTTTSTTTTIAPNCTFGSGLAQVYSILTSTSGSVTVVANIKKNNSSGSVTYVTVPYSTNTANAFLGGTTWNATDSLEIILTETVSSNPINVTSPLIFPNGSAALAPTSISGNLSPTVTLTFNGDSSGWGLGSTNMFFFNLTFSATL